MENHVPGVYKAKNGYWQARISVNGKAVHLVTSSSRQKCIDIRMTAEHAKQIGAFDEFLKKLKRSWEERNDCDNRERRMARADVPEFRKARMGSRTLERRY